MLLLADLVEELFAAMKRRRWARRMR
jgi:hypothetical protein